MKIYSLQDFLKYLEKNGELIRIKTEVDAKLEAAEISIRALQQGLPALLFENIKDSRFPLAMNVLASDKRIELALGKHPDQLGEELITFMEDAMPPKPKVFFKHPGITKRLISTLPKTTFWTTSQEVIQGTDLNGLPVITCWPEDGGPFITLPQVFTYDPRNGKRNVGMYRMQVFDGKTTGMHWQIQKGGGFHYFQSQKSGKPFEIAVALGTDPALLLATVAALPEGIDEVMFSGFLRGRRTRMAKGKTISIPVPADAEFILEGTVHLTELRMEGPFGDHFGHYSNASEFPVFHISAITHRKNPVYPATVVGRPPMEDKYLGNATQQVLGPLIRLIHPEIKNLWAYYEAGFHNLLVVSVEERYRKEAMKTALSIMGEGQLSLTKCVVTVSEEVNPRDFHAVLRAIHEHFDPAYDFIMIPKVPLDTLDFTSYKMNLGSKMIIDATRDDTAKKQVDRKTSQNFETLLKDIDNRIIHWNLLGEALLVVSVKENGREVVRNLTKSTGITGPAIIAAVSTDVDICNLEQTIWGIFTRFDAERDIVFTEEKLVGISPVFRGKMGIDATWKTGYPSPLVMPDEVVDRVNKNWDAYWK
ncbi:3-polyprenyl-4-hydroxybenzoate carboxy-lyase [Candidatus Kuenenia stuttgartiensis]|jgi:4-hydroxy-3-polyprenylbenzoate decarboxylase|uniref:3-polyprenyl-4-hydroxybenzoate carboxy-lyase n=1 Tax=Kuenenia stuttgartiensis TaxID=174633 RepID=Q1Q1P3_KUEST|nr:MULTISPECIES: menaquinone biosynthesis decarboxylase [Kuenenia]MBE7548607.1 menaquinone biosynthesis decarboxylase [Planctomycetia bacterium]MCF6152234.1 menaquinone biosynthesis decarboxylase [Candidatus Kuenenia stuttgartiensis]MCL4727511.1 menaquinone biosynthesis decarboxylase [Candidatus Kuenenia stuttgartiensis]MCZ7621519.1 menaquinone biosynthesis decarboxylase [Candidatus Kuenenia sp.]QII10941.1 3-polyprenyl-4-hydroxybenzoate carboxy-lyase [Candidatus Kuenenia stuttgartiensis]